MTERERLLLSAESPLAVELLRDAGRAADISRAHLFAQSLLLAVARLDLREALLALALDAQRALALEHLARDL